MSQQSFITTRERFTSLRRLARTSKHETDAFSNAAMAALLRDDLGYLALLSTYCYGDLLSFYPSGLRLRAIATQRSPRLPA